MESSAGRLRASRWLEALEKGLLDCQLRENLGEDEHLLKEHRAVLERALRGFLQHFGDEQPAVVIRSPGRINLIGMHVDHRGGAVNSIGIKDTVVVAVARSDDRVNLANEDPRFSRSSFRISEELPETPVADWDDWTAKNLVTLGRRHLSGHWSNYTRAAGCYLANWLWREKNLSPSSFKGMDAFVASNMPMAVGLSSSSVLVVAMARLFSLFNNLEIDDSSFIDHCGTAEWYVGTRGGKGDHAAILLSRRGKITHIAFSPFAVRYLSFPPEYRIIVCNSLVVSCKGAATRHAFNQRIASYEIGFLLLKKIAEARNLDTEALRMLRDVNPETLGISHRELLELLLELPEKIGRKEVEAKLGTGYKETLRKIWQTHPEPDGGYPIRDVCLYGVAECLRSKMAADVLHEGRIEEFAHLMNVSHDGDRVSRLVNGERVSWRSVFNEGSLRAGSGDEVLVHFQPGGYRVSTVEIDQLVDLALSIEGVLGARLTGAGYGGCVAILAHESAVKQLLAKLGAQYYTPRGEQLQAEVCQPLAGSNFFSAP